MGTIEWPTIVTAVVAVYGAGLSTYNLIAKIKSEKRKVTVELKWGLIGFADKTIPILALHAVNPGEKTVTLTQCHLELPNKKQLIITNSQGTIKLPHDLEKGKGGEIYFPIKEVVQALIREGYTKDIELKAVFRDALGNEYKSRPFKGDVSEWAKILRH